MLPPFHCSRRVPLFLRISMMAALFGSSLGYRILAIFPHPFKSHWLVFRPILEELARRGNNVTVLGHFPREYEADNYRDISIAESDTPVADDLSIEEMASRSQAKIIKDTIDKAVEITCRRGLRRPGVQALLNSDEKFDLIVTEIFLADCFLGFVHKFKVPFVGLRASPLTSWMNEQIANPANPAYLPNSYMGKSSRMGFLDRLENTVGHLAFLFYYRWHDCRTTEIAREHFGQDMPPLRDIAAQISVILVNSHFAHQFARPAVPGYREIAGVHLPQRKPLPKDLEEWITGAENGVIYFSFGSLLRTESLSPYKRQAFFEAFGELEQRVLIKWEGNQSDVFPRNVRTVKWSPQYDVISHPNVKLFIYHGGLLGVTEAVYAGKPMLLIPIFGDQPTNAALIREKGLAIVLEYSEVSKETLIEAVNELVEDPSYRKNAELASAVIQDRIVPPLVEAVYWIEYIARHRGAPWLRISAHGMPLYQYLLLDVVAFLVAVTALFLFAAIILLRRILPINSPDCYDKIKTE